jgi:hypothetical protein
MGLIVIGLFLVYVFANAWFFTALYALGGLVATAIGVSVFSRVCGRIAEGRREREYRRRVASANSCYASHVAIPSRERAVSEPSSSRRSTRAPDNTSAKRSRIDRQAHFKAPDDSLPSRLCRICGHHHRAGKCPQ